MEKIFKAKQRLTNTKADLEYTFKAIPLPQVYVRLDSFKVNGVKLEKDAFLKSYNGELEYIEVKKDGAKTVQNMFGIKSKNNTVHFIANEEVKKVYKEAYEWAINKNKELIEQEFNSLDDNDKVYLQMHTSYGAMIKIDSKELANESKWVKETQKILSNRNVKRTELIKKTIGDPYHVYLGDYSITESWKTTFGKLKELRAVFENEIEKVEEERKRKEEEKAKKREEEEAKIRPMSKEREQQYKVKVGEIKRITGGEGVDYECEIVVTSPEGKQFKFSARNIFDVGLVINPESGGLISYKNGEWIKETFDNKKGWYQVELSQDEKEAYWVAKKHVPASLYGIRM